MIMDLDKHKLLKNEDGKLIKSMTNLVTCFYIDENLSDLFIFNEFSGCIEYGKDAIWHDIKKGQELRDKDFIFVQYYLAHNKNFEMPIDKIRNSIIELAERHHYHPIREYLRNLEWDGEARLDQWLVNVCEAENNIYTRTIGSKYLMAAVARVYNPGIKFDNVLVLEGAENIGKSTVFRTLSSPWFTDSIDLMQNDAQIIEKMRGNWFLEVAELFGMNDKNQERIKSFLARQDDVHRLPYDKLTERLPRQSIFCGSSNKLAYLFGEEGNRRFWCVKCGNVNIEYLKDNKDQLFAEARDRWQNGEVLYLSPDLIEQAKVVQSQKLSVNEVWYDIIDRYLAGKNQVTMVDILKDCLKLELKELHNRAFTINVGRILKRMGFEKKDMNGKGKERFIYFREVHFAKIEEERLVVEEE